MNEIVYVKADLCQAAEPLIMHGCNAQGVMGSGVAKALRDKWPEIFRAYKALCYRSKLHTPSQIMGEVIPCPVSARHIVLNAITQENYGTVKQQTSNNPVKYVSYDAIDKATKFVARNYHGPLAMSKIGCGLGGGDWDIIERIIEKNLLPTIEVVVYEGP